MESNQEFNKLFKDYEAKVDQANQTYKDLSEIMKKVNKFLQSEASVDFFSLDCGLTTDGMKWYCES